MLPILWGILAQLRHTRRDLCVSGAATLCAWRNWKTAWWTHDQTGHSASTCWTQWPEKRVCKTDETDMSTLFHYIHSQKIAPAVDGLYNKWLTIFWDHFCEPITVYKSSFYFQIPYYSQSASCHFLSASLFHCNWHKRSWINCLIFCFCCCI